MLQELPMTPKEFAGYVRKLRSDLGSLEAAEKRCGKEITGSYINNIENLKVSVEDISVSKLVGLAKAINESPIQLFKLATGVDDAATTALSEKIALYLEDLPSNYQMDLLAILELLTQRNALEKKDETLEKPALHRVVGKTKQGAEIRAAKLENVKGREEENKEKRENGEQKQNHGMGK